MWHVSGRSEMYTGFWCGNLKERDHLEELGVDGSIILESVLKKWDERTWTGLIWFRLGKNVGLL